MSRASQPSTSNAIITSLLTYIPSTSRSTQPDVVLLQAPHNGHLPLVCSLLNTSLTSKHAVLVITFDVPGSYFTRALVSAANGKLNVVDHSGRIPGYEANGDNTGDVEDEVLSAVKALPAGPVTIAVVGLDTFSTDTNQLRAYTLIKSLHSTLTSRPSARLLISLSNGSPLAPLLIPPTSLSSDLTHLLLHPPSVLRHLSSQFLTLPPPYGESRKFWALFTGAVERGEGIHPRKVGIDQGLVECRARRRGRVERTLEGWKEVDGVVRACAWEDLNGMREMIEGLMRTGQGQPSTAQSSSDPTQNLSFNLSLTPAQEQARAAVPLPYMHAGGAEATQSTPASASGAIIYEPDSGDDVDDDDPDEDLDI